MYSQAVWNTLPKDMSRSLAVFTLLIGASMGVLNHGVVDPAIGTIQSTLQPVASQLWEKGVWPGLEVGGLVSFLDGKWVYFIDVWGTYMIG